MLTTWLQPGQVSWTDWSFSGTQSLWEDPQSNDFGLIHIEMEYFNNSWEGQGRHQDHFQALESPLVSLSPFQRLCFLVMDRRVWLSQQYHHP